jgi:hypothetical protein
MQNASYNRVNPAFKSKYADLAAIREATLPALNKHGLAIWQGTEVDEKGLRLTTRLLHKSGEWMESTYPIPLSDKPQVMGSALTYARRYTWAAACGITADEDDDAEIASKAKTNGNGHHAPQSGPITAEQAKTLRNAVKEVEADEALFTRYLKVDSLEGLPASQFPRAMAALDAKRAAK